jgi:hypothetical protein
MSNNKKIILKRKIKNNIRRGIFSPRKFSFFVNKVSYSKIKSLEENWVFVIVNLWLLAMILSFVTIVGYFFNYFLHLVVLATTLQLIFLSFSHLNKFEHGFHPKRPIYVPLVANLVKWVAKLCVFKVYFEHSKVYGIITMYNMYSIQQYMGGN